MYALLSASHSWNVILYKSLGCCFPYTYKLHEAELVNTDYMNAVSDTVYSENLILALLTLNLFRVPQLDVIFNFLKEIKVYIL